MKGPTISFDADWRLTAVPPAQVCPKCGGKWAGGSGPHGAHFRADGLLVDCVGGTVDTGLRLTGRDGRSTSEGA